MLALRLRVHPFRSGEEGLLTSVSMTEFRRIKGHQAAYVQNKGHLCLLVGNL